MSIRAQGMITWRHVLLAGCIALLAGCGPTDETPQQQEVPPSSVPAAPANLSASAGDKSVSLSWSASSGASNYHVMRGTASGGPYTPIASPASPAYTDTGVTNGNTYYYVVSARNAAGESTRSNQVSASPAAPATAPATPTGLQAVAGNGQVSLNWTATGGATGYKIKRRTGGSGAFEPLVSTTSPSHVDASAANGITYYYVVAATNAVGDSSDSSPVSATPSAPVSPPAAPAGLQATPGDKQVALKWTAVSGATGYKVKRATSSGGTYSEIASPTMASYRDSGLTNGTTYYYKVMAFNASGNGADSSIVSARPSAEISLTGLKVSGNQIVNGLDQVVSLRGVDKSGTEYMCIGGPDVFDGPSNQASVNVLKSWAINIVRLPINEDCWLGINGVAVGGTAYQNAVEAYVNLLTAANIAVIIDLQWAAPGKTLSNTLTPMPDADHAPDFWTSVANKFKSNSSVLFDLFNEPFPDNNSDTNAAWACLKNGGTCEGVSYQTASMQSLVNAVRATGASNIIMVPGVQFTNVLSQWLANKPADPKGNIVASWHSYADQICASKSCWDSVIKPILQTTPVIAGEIGQGDCQSNFVKPLMDYLDTNGGHYLAWAWNTYDCSGFPSLISNFDGTPTTFGAGIRDHYLSKAGITPPPPPEVPFLSSTYPFGIAVGSTTQYMAADGTIYYPDVAGSAMSLSMQFFQPFTVNDSITGTPDPLLYKKGRAGNWGAWTINVPNGNYRVTLGMAPNSAHDAGEFGQDQYLQDEKVGTCVWSKYSGTNTSPTSHTSCPGNVTSPAPALDTVKTVSYEVAVFNQQLKIQPAASFGDGRTTVLNTIKVEKLP